MKFIFVSTVGVDAFGKWNGFVARFTHGIGGTESAIMYMAEHIAEQGHQAIVVSLLNSFDEITYNHVTYVNFDNFSSQECNYIILTNNLLSTYILHKITSYQYVFVVSHGLPQGNSPYIDQLFQQHIQKTIFLFISEYAKSETKRLFPFVHAHRHLLIENCLNSNEIQPITPKENTFCFFPCIERGLTECLAVCKHFPEFTCYLSTYHNPNYNKLQNSTQCIRLPNTSRMSIYESLTKSKYFVYSAFNAERGLFHYDTFGYVIYEALIHGVIVISVPMDVYVELYGDAVYYIPIDHKYLDQDDTIPHPELSEYISNEFIKAIELFESSPLLQQQQIEKGKQLLCKFNQTASIQKLFSFLQLPYQPITYQYLFLVSTPHTSTKWNGYLNPPSTLQHIITFAEQTVTRAVICSLENMIIPVHHNNTLYINYNSLPNTHYTRIILIHEIPIDILFSIRHTLLCVSQNLHPSYLKYPHSVFQSLSEVILPLSSPPPLQNTLPEIPVPFQSRKCSSRLIVLLHSQPYSLLRQLYSQYPFHEIDVYLVVPSTIKHTGITYCSQITNRLYEHCVMDELTPESKQIYDSYLFGIPFSLLNASKVKL